MHKVLKSSVDQRLSHISNGELCNNIQPALATYAFFADEFAFLDYVNKVTTSEAWD